MFHNSNYRMISVKKNCLMQNLSKEKEKKQNYPLFPYQLSYCLYELILTWYNGNTNAYKWL